MHTGRLVLTPSDPFHLPADSDAILERLHDIGFCGARLPIRGGQHYLLGERFLQLVSFMGCSPHIQLEPGPADQAFCHLIMDSPTPQPIFLSGRNTTSPRCEHCRKRIPDWPAVMARWLEAPTTYLADCPHCAHRQNPASYDWRHSAGTGRLFLFVENIFPNEAIPSAELLQTLQDPHTGMAWSYFYIQD